MCQFWKVRKEFPFSPGGFGIIEAMYSQVGEIQMRLDGQFVVGLYARRSYSQVGRVRHHMQSMVFIMALNCEVDDVGAGG